MAAHVTHFGVHDHGFNNVSTYGNLLRLMNEGRIPEDPWERDFYEMALKASGASRQVVGPILPAAVYLFVQWTTLVVCRHNPFVAILGSCTPTGPFVDDGKRREISLLDRLIQHARTTADYAVYYGDGRDTYDMRGRTAHESIFNVNDGNYRCPNSQQGYSPFTTWTRGLAWIMAGAQSSWSF